MNNPGRVNTWSLNVVWWGLLSPVSYWSPPPNLESSCLVSRPPTLSVLLISPPSAHLEAGFWKIYTPRAPLEAVKQIFTSSRCHRQRNRHTMLSCQPHPVQTQPRVWATDLTSHTWYQSWVGGPGGPLGPVDTKSWPAEMVRLKEETEQALSWEQDSILGQTMGFELYA